MHSIVIPAYNEEKRVGRTLADYSGYFDKKGGDYELVVVCDGCTDRTADVVRALVRKNRKIKLFEVGSRLGKGGGVYYGFSKCSGDTVGFSDADDAVVPREYDKLLGALSGCDLAIASRREKNSVMIVPNAKKSWVVSMRVASKVFNILMNAVFGIGIKDTQCGAKVMKRGVYDAVKKQFFVKGFEFDVELIWVVKKNGFRVKEVGVRWMHDLDSKSSLKNSGKMLFSLLNRRVKG